MTTPRHLGLFLTLGLFWGISPSLYRHWGILGVPVSHIIFLTGIGVAAALAVICQLRGIDWIVGKRLQFFGLVDINGSSEEMTVRLMDREDQELWRITLPPMRPA